MVLLKEWKSAESKRYKEEQLYPEEHAGWNTTCLADEQLLF